MGAQITSGFLTHPGVKRCGFESKLRRMSGPGALGAGIHKKVFTRQPFCEHLQFGFWKDACSDEFCKKWIR